MAEICPQKGNLHMLAFATLAASASLLSARAAPKTLGANVASRAFVAMSSAYDYSARDLRTGGVVELSQYEGKVSLVVNVASK